jgi:hypothetical protein
VLELVNLIEKVVAKNPRASVVLRAEVRGVRIVVCRRLQTDTSARTILSTEGMWATKKLSTNALGKRLLPDLPSRDNTNRQQSFYSIPELAIRWRCSRGTVYNRLRFAGAKVLDFASAGKKGKKLVLASTIFQIESKHLKALP